MVTGANAGIGYEASRWLAVDYGARMIMGCRCRSTKGKCDGAAATINAELKKEAKDRLGIGGIRDAHACRPVEL